MKLEQWIINVVVAVLIIVCAILAYFLNDVGVSKNKLEAEVTTLRNDNTSLTFEKTNLEGQVSTLTTEKTNLESTVSTLETEKTSLTTQRDGYLNDVAKYQKMYYHRANDNSWRYIIYPQGKENSVLTIISNNLAHSKSSNGSTAFSMYRNVNNSKNYSDFPKTSQKLFLYTNINYSPLTLLQLYTIPEPDLIRNKEEEEYNTAVQNNDTELINYNFIIRRYKKPSSEAGTYKFSDFFENNEEVPLNKDNLYFIFVETVSFPRILFIDDTQEQANVLTEVYDYNKDFTVTTKGSKPVGISKYLFNFGAKIDARWDGGVEKLLGEGISMPNLLPYNQTYT